MPEVTLAPPTQHNPQSQVLPEMLIPEEGWILALSELQKIHAQIQNIEGGETETFTSVISAAETGKIPFLHIKKEIHQTQDWNNFIIFLSQRNSHIKIGSSYSTISTLHSDNQDQINEIGILHAIKNLSILVAADYYETCKMVEAAAHHRGPCFIRFANSKTPVVTTSFSQFQIGQANTLREGNDVAIVTYGTMVYHALSASRILEAQGIRVRVINMHTLNPLDKETIQKAAHDTEGLLVVEDPFNLSGVANDISRIVCESKPVPIEVIDHEVDNSSQGYQRAIHSADHERTQQIVAGVKRVIERKVGRE